MKLILSLVNSGGSRLGKLCEVGRHGDLSMETPCCLLYTRCGLPPHLTPDVMRTLKRLPAATQLTLPTLAESHETVEGIPGGIGHFIGIQNTLYYLSLQDPGIQTPSGYNDKSSASIWVSAGRMRLHVDQYMSMQKAFKPDWYEAMYDGDTPLGCSRKKIQKSINRTLNFLDKCLNIHEESDDLKSSEIFGVIEGGDLLEERLHSVRETVKRPVAGFVLDGFQRYMMHDDARRKLLAAVVKELPEDKPRLLHGLGRPDDIIDAVEAGVDIFDSSFPYNVTERCCALVFPFKKLEELEHGSKDEKQGGCFDGLQSSVESFIGNVPFDSDDTNKDTCKKTEFEINLREQRYFDDFSPLVKNCECYSCEHHTRAYINHLLRTKELLGPVLLMLHNFHHYFEFFHELRESLRNGSLDQLKDLIKQSSS
ncbi:queuine tRNA-ribosyltransferase accessory subunit 2-like [Anneissia japonica]|uniref:queuine tRNA-ribosyltransferase accessory subunit 2-like n=1 Tax=Anneissia japonica TaxID=1529436 RepID=UPI00142582B7|nr:queuine tRNA-ribosyltransferase accessory subunit 2-like [Anneissia japonica]